MPTPKSGFIQRAFYIALPLDRLLNFLSAGLETHRSAIVCDALKEYAEKRKHIPGVTEELAALVDSEVLAS